MKILNFFKNLFTTRRVFKTKSGLKITMCGSSIITEWDWDSPVQKLRLLNIFRQISQDNPEEHEKYSKQFEELREELKTKGYDVSSFY